MDTWYITSSPLRIRKKHVYWLGGLAAASAVLYHNDERLVTRIREVRSHNGWKQFLDIGNTFEPLGYMGFTNKYYAAGVGIGYLFRLNWLTRISGEILEANLVAGIFKNLATVLSHHVDRWPFTIAAYSIATTVGFQRFESRGHWPSDVLIGAALGTVVSQTIVRLHEDNAMSLSPCIDGRSGSLGVKWQWWF